MPKIRCLIILLFLSTINPSNAQEVYQELNKYSIYTFLDELANQQTIELNTFAKPYSRKLIAHKLKEAKANSDGLNQRQKDELEFFMKDYGKELNSGAFNKRLDLFYYKDSLFTLSLNPILGAKFISNENGAQFSRWHGGEAFAYMGAQFGAYVSLRDNIEDEQIQSPNYINNDQGIIYKGSGDYSDVRGGMSYSWKWGSLNLVKDHLEWGNNQFGSNLISNKAPSFTRLEFNLSPVHWLDFRYFHGWLSSRVRDSARSYLAGVKKRNIDVSKFMASNALTIRPIPRLNFTLGNSIVYSDDLQAAFFIPFMFFKSIDHSIYSGGGNFGGANTQIFFELSSRNVKKTHLYSTLFIDEISFERMWDKDRHSNFISWKVGAEWSNILHKNIGAGVEYTRTNPITFRHFVNTTTFSTNDYNLGHYLRDNAQEIAFTVNYKPIARLLIDAHYVISEKGIEYNYPGTNTSVWGLKFIEQQAWKRQELALSIRYELKNDLFMNASYSNQTISGVNQLLWTDDLFQGQTNTLQVGLNIGF